MRVPSSQKGRKYLIKGREVIRNEGISLLGGWIHLLLFLTVKRSSSAYAWASGGSRTAVVLPATREKRKEVAHILHWLCPEGESEEGITETLGVKAKEGTNVSGGPVTATLFPALLFFSRSHQNNPLDVHARTGSNCISGPSMIIHTWRTNGCRVTDDNNWEILKLTRPRQITWALLLVSVGSESTYSLSIGSRWSRTSPPYLL